MLFFSFDLNCIFGSRLYKQASKDKKLGYDATQLNWNNNGEYLLISGSNKECNLYTNEGIKLQTIAQKESWILCAKQKPNSNFIVRFK